MAAFKASARSLDQGVGAVLHGLDEAGLADNTLLVLTTDHGLPFPGAKGTLSDRGLGVMQIIRGPDGFFGGHVTDALTSHLDLYPTLLEAAHAPIPDGTQGRSLLPLVRRQAASVRQQLFAELTYHAAYDPQRAVRTERHKLIEHFGDRLEPVLPNVDDSPSKTLLMEAGWGSHPRPRVEVYDLVMDPGEMRNLADAPEFADLRGDLERRLHEWMTQTNDPLLDGPVPAPPGAFINNPDGISAREPCIEAVD
jgi:arylsulfatase A-like enzyme